jgi:hypothetical protein
MQRGSSAVEQSPVSTSLLCRPRYLTFIWTGSHHWDKGLFCKEAPMEPCYCTPLLQIACFLYNSLPPPHWIYSTVKERWTTFPQYKPSLPQHACGGTHCIHIMHGMRAHPKLSYFFLCKYCTDESINISMCLVWHLDTATYTPPTQILINHSFKWVWGRSTIPIPNPCSLMMCERLWQCREYARSNPLFSTDECERRIQRRPEGITA